MFAIIPNSKQNLRTGYHHEIAAGQNLGRADQTASPNRQIVVFQNRFNHDVLRRWRRESSIAKVAFSADFQSVNWTNDKTRDADLVIYDKLGVGLLNIDDPEQMSWFKERTRRQKAILNMRPEHRMSILLAPTGPFSEYQNQTETDALFDADIARSSTLQTHEVGHSGKAYSDSRRLTWAMHATGLSRLKYNGDGAKIAILDTGLDFNHQDWRNREMVSRSFVGPSALDDHGHGTQCAGLAGGRPIDPAYPRYGAAPKADLHIAKVLEKDGTGPDSSILAGIDWAISHGCHVLSLSVGVQSSSHTHDPVYETVAQRCLKSGMLFIAAAGNDSSRPNLIRPVCRPASCPSIFAVGAVDRYLRVAHFSNGTVWPGACQVDGVAPGVDVLTTSSGAKPYGRFSGTSMAAPLCAGIAAVLVQQDGSRLGPALWQQLSAFSRRLPIHSTDVGNGLICIPR